MLHAYASFLGNAPTTPAGPVAQHNNVKLARADMLKGGTDDGHVAADGCKAWMKSKKAVQLANMAKAKMDKANEAKEAKLAKWKAKEDAKAKIAKQVMKATANMAQAKPMAKHKAELTEEAMDKAKAKGAKTQTTLEPFMKPGMHPELMPSKKDVTDEQKVAWQDCQVSHGSIFQYTHNIYIHIYI